MDRSPRIGVFIMMLAAIGFGGGDIGVKVLGENLSPWQITAGRGFLGLVIILALSRFNIGHFMIKQWPCQMLLGLTGALGYACFVFSLKWLPLSIAMPLGYVYPAMGALLSPFINREKPGRADWIAIGLALAAVICLSRGTTPEPGASLVMGFVIGLIGAFFIAVMTNLARRQTQTILLNVNLFYLFLGNFVLGLPLSLALDSVLIPPAVDLAKLFCCIAPASITGFWLMFIGYRHISAHRGGIVLTLEAVITSLYGLVFLGEPLTLWAVLGLALILLSGVIIIRSSAVSAVRV
ncbi:DMT family transporter [Deltaproteobacteria bacterium OttesenSCG-928-M10]|nr:DMT family transporter [Deltaproteobacteria bacterium OttesenSCG-928-M10]